MRRGMARKRTLALVAAQSSSGFPEVSTRPGGAAPPPGGGLVGPCLGAVLAGGASRRMGTDKALLAWRGRPLARVVAERLRRVVPRVVVVGGGGRGYERLGLPLLPDPPGLAGRGPLAGLLAALGWVTGGGAVLLAGCDMPDIDPPGLRRLLALAVGAPATATTQAGRLQPLPGVYRPEILPAARWSLARGRGRLVDLFLVPGCRVLTAAQLGGPGRIAGFIRNINYPSDL